MSGRALALEGKGVLRAFAHLVVPLALWGALGSCVQANDEADGGSAGGDACTDCVDTTPACTAGTLWAPDLARCVQCNTTADCGAGPAALGVCHPTRRQCVACYEDAQCESGVCHPERLYCVECLADVDCGSGDCDEAQQVCRGCGSAADCDDGNACTAERCEDKVCISTPEVDGAPCEADVCTADDTCQAGRCVAGTALAVDAQGAALLGCRPCDGANPCSEAEVCVDPAGHCGAGTCHPRPTDCAVADEVCGCDGKTYRGACAANAAGSDVGRPGACPCAAVGLPCGLEQGLDTDDDGCLDACRCDGSTFCASGWACTSCEAGVCEPAPECDSTTPVCSCDGQTWSSACAAYAAGHAVAAVGACCVPAPCPGGTLRDLDGDGCAETCECVTGADCPTGAWCEAAECGAAGICRPGCGAGPVCGCDGKAYASSCEAPAVAHAGVCCPDAPTCEGAVDLDGDGCPDTCKCELGGACPGAQRCQPSGCGSNDGLCRTCDTSSPVCGCDGRTWASQCAAWEAGVAVVQKTACPCAKGLCAVGQYCLSQGETPGGAVSCAETSGVCLDCPADDGPVCTCSGVTAPSRCGATEKGLRIVHAGQCTPCKSSDQCPAGTVCDRSASQCTEAGVCRELPASCPDEPVCGCESGDWKTACDLAAGGDALKGNGACCPAVACAPGGVLVDTNGDGCGDLCKLECQPATCASGIAPVDDDGDGCPEACPCKQVTHCDADSYCKRAVGDCGGVGRCTTIPAQCTEPLGFVCGCDGVTYKSECAAAKSGTTPATNTACCAAFTCSSGQLGVDTTGDGCPDTCKQKPCVADWECGDATWYCARTAGACTTTGLCQVRATDCGGLAAAPVCGCDGESYKTACAASEAGRSVAFDGACKCKPVCATGFVLLDANGDGCPEGCVPQCANGCDCQKASTTAPLLTCPSPLVPAWTCSTGGCKAVCSVEPTVCL